jgi:hypothetical protein
MQANQVIVVLTHGEETLLAGGLRSRPHWRLKVLIPVRPQIHPPAGYGKGGRPHSLHGGIGHPSGCNHPGPSIQFLLKLLNRSV